LRPTALKAVALIAALWGIAAATPALAEAPRARVEGELDRDLRDLLERAAGVSPERPASRFDARRRARQAAEAVVAALRSEGYYASVVEAEVGEGETPDAIVRVTPGPRFVFAETAIAWQGEPPADPARAAALSATGLAEGAPGRSEDVVEAEGRAVAAISARGYADARATPREVIVDHATKTVQPTYRLAAGPLVRLDGLQMETTGRTRRDWILRLAPWKEGEVYDPEDVAELERRLLDTGVYDTVTVALAPPANTTTEGLRPVVVSLADRPRRTIEIGAGYSTSEGAGFEAEFNRYNQFGRGDTLTISTTLAQIERRLQGQLSLPHFGRAGRTLRLGTEIFQDETNAYDEAGVGVRADLEQRFGRTTFFTYGVRADVSQTNELGTERNFFILTGLGGFNLDRSSDPLDPKSGWRLEARAEPTALTGDNSLVFLRAQTQATAYYPFTDDARTLVAGRVRLGSILGGLIPEVPAGRRFYAGGGGSVRGYEYQAIGPRLADNTPAGGLSLFETSLELRRSGFGDRGVWRALGGVAFIDAGSVGSEQYPDFGEIKAAVGVGVRFDLGFAPVRADVAVPLNKRDGEAPFQIYLSLGQAF
jgi:translocation and assembly module TamA